MASSRDTLTTNPTSENRKADDSTARPYRDPSIPTSIPTTSRGPEIKLVESKSQCRSDAENCFKFIYNRENKTFCDRTRQSWGHIIVYSIMYLLFLTTYTAIFLYGSLQIIKSTTNYANPHARLMIPLIYAKDGVGLSATPTADTTNGNLIWYTSREGIEYQKYINAIEELLLSRRKRQEVIRSLGPCGKFPYGYGEKPCVIIRINKQLDWAGKPLSQNSTLLHVAPDDVKNWVKSGKKMLWLHCRGYNAYDQEHIGNINYYPYPPGFDPKLYPIDIKKDSPLIAVQISDFSRGISLGIECKLWYELGPSSVYFTLYVAPPKATHNTSSRH